MVVPELKAWRAARPHVERIARAVRPWLVRALETVRRSLVQAVEAVRPWLVRASGAVRPWFARLTTVQFTAGAALLGLALTATVVTAAGPWDSSGQRTAERDLAASREGAGGADHGTGSGPGSGTSPKAPRPAPSAPSVLAGLGRTTGTVSSPTEKALADVLDPLLDDPSLGSERTAAVVDVATGKRLYGKAADEALTPASTTKIATAVAALSAAGADHRIATRTALEPGTKELVLVGGGDPTLTAREEANGNASLRTLADKTARALKSRKLDAVTLSYDTTLYDGPALHPIGPNNANIAPVTALMADEGRLDDSSSGTADRSTDPAADAARQFAALLKDRGIKSKSPGPSKATGRAESLAKVESPPLSALVERMLTNSDNDIAEALARQTALASGEQASFEGASAAIRTQLKKLELPLEGVEFADGSGLDRADRLTANLLTALLAKAGAPEHPELRPALTGLPVAGFTGTLRNRYTDQPGTGVVRAKTGTLTGVHALAGTVVDTEGRLLAFAFLTSSNRPMDPAATQKALDGAASALANCGCGA
ncbi:D-alanyl-D-alanine carboxypeptidase/D-alanyl-D-alanine endopeptidase [Streptomyces ureilyticus]|uniref:D-alanyl-D-alanine carboxypeptidase/D-alanyl-D-alanine-endopeptidase n=1 Tax=Streptomyces ureilyticus TaxID=1775131 RepID=A0ABX0DKA0_9ACTN|nr:D-alanyl-D-alanine carboxypeptidase/D-alanyl-D-alanine-endopeptidase [Streptomyces ureilyticus]NGO41947.1 D-alanyl-D-alanine carboxypeptidase/D-alanyl-D-alanine-endopeptidase [Streptomyces ureilyticus]